MLTRLYTRDKGRCKCDAITISILTLITEAFVSSIEFSSRQAALRYPRDADKLAMLCFTVPPCTAMYYNAGAK